MPWLLWLVLVLLSLAMVMGLARMSQSFLRQHINEGILLTIYNHRPVVAAHRGYTSMHTTLSPFSQWRKT